MFKFCRSLAIICAVAAAPLLLASCGRNDAGPAARIAVQHEGRVKSLESFARSELRLIAGRESYNRRPALEVMLRALQDPALIASIPWIEIEYVPLKEKLNLDPSRRRFSFAELVGSRGTVESLYMASQAKRNADQRPEKIEQKAERLQAQIQTVEGLISGDSLRVLPPAAAGAEWASPFGMTSPFEPSFRDVVQSLGNKTFDSLVTGWTSKVDGLTGGVWRKRLDAEAFYHILHPFRWAYLLYFSGFFFWLFFRKNPFAAAAITCMAIAFAFHTAGLVLRVYILGRPPVSNMYESMVYMNWTLMVFAFLFGAVRRSTIAVAVGGLLSGLVMVYSNLLPIDPGLEVLVPVLRSNYWLSIHVMTIVSSYGAFGLAMALGHRHLFLARVGRFNASDSTASGDLMYGLIKLGVLLLGIGTVLGGVWANESWGRFWGWDPKETWALITLLGYLIIVHLRHKGWLDAFGTAVGSILGFLLVLMTWYGVNFVLGRGLHSYGSGSGGMNWILAFLAFEAAFLAFALTKRRA